MNLIILTIIIIQIGISAKMKGNIRYSNSFQIPGIEFCLIHKPSSRANHKQLPITAVSIIQIIVDKIKSLNLDTSILLHNSFSLQKYNIRTINIKSIGNQRYISLFFMNS